MTAKAKPRTAPAARTATPDAPYDHTNINNLIARLRFLEADCRYQAAICDPAVKSVALNIRHSEERAAIMQQLSKTVPDHFDDAMALLDFATKWLKALTDRGRVSPDQAIIDMLKNARTGLFKANIKMRMDFALRSFDELIRLIAKLYKASL